MGCQRDPALRDDLRVRAAHPLAGDGSLGSRMSGSADSSRRNSRSTVSAISAGGHLQRAVLRQVGSSMPPAWVEAVRQHGDRATE